MSPSKPPTWSSPRKPAPSQEVGNDHNLNNPATDLSSTNSLPSRVPLCPIPLPSQVAEGVDNTDLSRFNGKSDISTPKCKSKTHSQRLECVENPELLQFKGKPEASTPRGRSKLYFQVNEGESESLPQVYDPDTIAAYWSKRPGAVVTRIAQLLSVAGGFLSGIASDIITKKVKEVFYFNP